MCGNSDKVTNGGLAVAWKAMKRRISGTGCKRRRLDGVMDGPQRLPAREPGHHTFIGRITICNPSRCSRRCTASEAWLCSMRTSQLSAVKISLLVK